LRKPEFAGKIFLKFFFNTTQFCRQMETLFAADSFEGNPHSGKLPQHSAMQAAQDNLPMPYFFQQFNYLKGFWHCQAGIVVAVALITSGCSTTTTQSFQRTKNSNVEASYVATDANFGKYSQLRGEDMGIFFPESSPIPEEDLQRIRQIFRDAFLGELEGYEIVENTGPQVMTVQASLIDLREADLGDVPDMRPGLGAVARPGVLVFTMEMRDTDRVLARAADSTSNPKIGTGGGRSTDWNDVQTAAQFWASLFRQFLDQNLDRGR
jgi:hypothetical protein